MIWFRDSYIGTGKKIYTKAIVRFSTAKLQSVRDTGNNIDTGTITVTRHSSISLPGQLCSRDQGSRSVGKLVFIKNVRFHKTGHHLRFFM
jgi:hypothetical protein